MKKRVFFLPALPLLFATTALGQIVVTTTGVTETFATVPAAANWSSRTIAGDNAAINTLSQLTTAVNAVTAESVNTILGTTTTFGTTAGVARVNTAQQKLQSGPTTISAVLFMATLKNGSGVTAPGVTISYDLNRNATTVAEQIPLEAYYSTTGLANSWTQITALSGDVGTSATAKSATISLGAWSPNARLYVLWADDNSTSGTDNVYLLDNVKFTAVPEPSEVALASGFALGLFVIARRIIKSRA